MQKNSEWKSLIKEDLPDPPMQMPKGIWQVLHSRGLHSLHQLEEHFSPSLQGLTPPENLSDIGPASQILKDAFLQNEKVAIYADFDLDGTPGLALLLDGLQRLGFKDVTYYQPKRISEGYGIHKHAIEKLHSEGVKVLLTVDVGITDIDAIKLAKDLGMKVVVTDHHLPKESLPDADAIVNPNKGTCESGLGHLCGTGVAFYLVLALRSLFKSEGLLKKDFNPKELLDLFAIGTITDMVPLVRENRVLVKHGLKVLKDTKRVGLKVLIEALQLKGRELNAQDVGFKIAPKLNALSRLELGLLPIDLLLAKTDDEAYNMVSEVFKTHELRVSWQKDAESEALDQYKANKQQGYAWVWSENFHKGIVGLVATKLTQKLGVPAFVGSVNKEGKVIGSARVPEEGVLNLLDVLTHSEDHMVKFGGHAPAAGFEIKLESAEDFNASLQEFFVENQFDWSSPNDVKFESRLYLNELNESFMGWYEALGPFGREFESPHFLLEGVELKNIKALKGEHYKLEIGAPATWTNFSALWFSVPPTHQFHPKKLKKGDVLDALVEPQWNEFAGRRTLQLLLKDIRVSF